MAVFGLDLKVCTIASLEGIGHFSAIVPLMFANALIPFNVNCSRRVGVDCSRERPRIHLVIGSVSTAFFLERRSDQLGKNVDKF